MRQRVGRRRNLRCGKRVDERSEAFGIARSCCTLTSVAQRVVDRVLQLNYVEANAHLVAATAHKELKHDEQAKFHRYVADGLLRSITSKGDGTTAETAYQVIDVSEEYAWFRSMNLTVKMQSIVGLPEPGPIG